MSEIQVQDAIAAVEKLAEKEIADGSIAGLSMAVVYQDKLIYSKGFGFADSTTNAPVDADTAFQLASVSKSVGSTVMAALVGENVVTWDTKISDLDPDFEMFDAWVTREITLRDFYAHRSGWPEHAGDLLEDIGYARAAVLHRMRYQKPDLSFRSHYAYTNIGMSEAAYAAARAAGKPWEELSREKLYAPLGMTATDSSFAGFMALKNKARGQIKRDGKWVQQEQRNPDVQTPAGGASSSANDMAKWIRLQLANGKFDGKQLIPGAALDQTHAPQMVTGRNPFTGLPTFYGLGWNVSFDERGLLHLGHSGGFALGAATNVSLVPAEGVGIVALTNSPPAGVPEALNTIFMDTVLNGKPQHDWMAIYKKIFLDPASIGVTMGFDYSKPPAAATPALENAAYVGRYANDFYGEVEVRQGGGGLVFVLGPKKIELPMTHYTRDTFTYESFGENAAGTVGLVFTISADGKANTVLAEHLATTSDGIFRRSE